MLWEGGGAWGGLAAQLTVANDKFATVKRIGPDTRQYMNIINVFELFLVLATN